MTNTLEIARTIQAQIGARRMMAIGSKNLLALQEKGAQLGGLQFDASLFGARRCRVVVRLMASDVYTLEIYKPRAEKPLASFDDVYADHLGRDVEDLVEGFFAQK